MPAKNGREDARLVALSALRYNPAIRQFAEQWKQKGKQGKMILVAWMRKMLVTLEAMRRDHVPWLNQFIPLEFNTAALHGARGF